MLAGAVELHVEWNAGIAGCNSDPNLHPSAGVIVRDGGFC
jgi:hypothetical protein